nr:type I-C CRISPR-associated protein Cas8c/Csd1 [uncultured Sphaerochaeta sp.]
MILQALKSYYDRLSADPNSDIAPIGWSKVEIPFVFIINYQGELIQIEDTREYKDKKLRAKSFFVPQGIKKTSGVAANFLWDSSTYVTGCFVKEGLEGAALEKAVGRATEQHAAFIGRIEQILPVSPKRNACIKFLNSIDEDTLQQFEIWEEIRDSNANTGIRFEDDLHLYCQDEEVKSVYPMKDSDSQQKVCLITGELDTPSLLHTAIKGVYGAQTSGANIVSYNLKPFLSYGKKQGENAPIGETAMFAYTTALNTLLAKDSKQRMQVGDASTVFWSERESLFETDFSLLFSEPSKDDPNANTQCIRSLFNAPKTGEYYASSQENRFYVLGLSPNAARLSVRFWLVGEISEFAKHIRQHFIDLGIQKSASEPEYYSIWRLLIQTAQQGKTENIPPNISGDFMQAILLGKPYPQSLLQAVLRRIKSDSEHRVNPPRAALIKAFLNRLMRYHPESDEKELQMALDIEQTSIGYQLGRLMAALEKIQEEANPGINSTITDRYYGAACSTPVTVFGTLMRLMRYHLDKIETQGRRVYFEKLVGEIVGRISEFPAHLGIYEQGKFAVGYYHQRQAFYTKKDSE